MKLKNRENECPKDIFFFLIKKSIEIRLLDLPKKFEAYYCIFAYNIVTAAIKLNMYLPQNDLKK